MVLKLFAVALCMVVCANAPDGASSADAPKMVVGSGSIVDGVRIDVVLPKPAQPTSWDARSADAWITLTNTTANGLQLSCFPLSLNLKVDISSPTGTRIHVRAVPRFLSEISGNSYVSPGAVRSIPIRIRDWLDGAKPGTYYIKATLQLTIFGLAPKFAHTYLFVSDRQPIRVKIPAYLDAEQILQRHRLRSVAEMQVTALNLMTYGQFIKMYAHRPMYASAQTIIWVLQSVRHASSTVDVYDAITGFNYDHVEEQGQPVARAAGWGQVAGLPQPAPSTALTGHATSSDSLSGTPNRGIALALHSGSMVFSWSNPIELSVELRNVSGSEMLLTGFAMPSAYAFTVTNEATGEVLHGQGPASDVYSAGPMHFAAGYSWFSLFDLRNFVHLTEPGTYDVAIKSQSLRVGEKMTTLAAESNHITLQITP